MKKKVEESQGPEIQLDLSKVSETIHQWIETLPPAKREHLKQEFSNAKKLFSSPEFLKDFQPSKPFSENSLQEILDISKETMHDFYKLAYDLYQNGQSEKSRGLFRFLTLLNPLGVDYWIGLGTIFLVESRVYDAHATFEIARSLDDNNPESYYFLALSQHMLGNSEQALKLVQNSITLSKKAVNTTCLNSATLLEKKIQENLKK